MPPTPEDSAMTNTTFRRVAAFSTATLAAVALGASAQASVIVVDGLNVDADWNADHTASGRVVIDGVIFDDADITLDGGVLTGTVYSDIDIADGCVVETRQTHFGIAPGDIIREDVADAPVQDDQSYLYFATSDDQVLACFGIEATLAEGTSTEFYVNPLDPSVFVSTSDFLPPESDVLPVTAEALTVGLSAEGLIPWKSSVKGDNGKKESFDAHQVLGGDFEVDVQGIPLSVENGTSGWVWSDDGELETVCFSGEMAIAGYDFPVLGGIDLPLGEGVACKDGKYLNIHADVDMNQWADLGLPADLQDAIERMGGKKAEINGWINTNNGKFELAVAQNFPLYGNVLKVDGELIITHDSLSLEGKSDVELGELDFGKLKVDVSFNSNGKMKAKASGDAKIPGTSGKTLDADFAWDRNGLEADASAKLWGFKVKGDLAFDGYTLKKTTLSTRFDAKVASGKVKLILKNSNVDVRVEGEALGVDFDLGLSSKGCFKVAGSEICLSDI